ncbi:hypothetical protein [Altericista sp. CCNU0014]|uniref:hypothetical protein n=1 Tax=Altericista sp. CCNU0014 TaxID=3082949 RepID=UPI00384E615C
MKQWLNQSPKILLVTIGAMYGVYLLKTLLGINLSNSHSASWVLKAPLEPVWSHRTELCGEFQTLCTLRSRIMHKVQNQIVQAKRAIS